jgi:EAL domain-containing protein (putative c-di-GMP-specific phosphodiesterase class I)
MPCRDLRFLVVEDHSFQRAVMAQLLKAMGAGAVHLAEDGRAALEVIADPGRPVDIVVSDLSMPGMDGMQFVRHLSELGAPVSLILASALDAGVLATVARMARAYNVRILGVMGKPPSAAKLAPLIELHRAGPPDPAIAPAGIPLHEIATSWTNHDFSPWFEVEVDLDTGVLCSLRAVPRWRHPERGLLGLAAFLPSIRARGLQEEFAWLLLQQSAARCAWWRARGVAAGVSIPLLFEDCSNVGLAGRVAEVVAATQLQPQDVVLSVPPGTLGTGTGPVLENLARLRMGGFALALEYSGSEVLPEPDTLGAFTHLRIAAELVAQVDGDAAVRERLAGALKLARSANLLTTAEGIARSQERAVLREGGCQRGQGPLIAPILHGDAVVEWARHRAVQ